MRNIGFLAAFVLFCTLAPEWAKAQTLSMSAVSPIQPLDYRDPRWSGPAWEARCIDKDACGKWQKAVKMIQRYHDTFEKISGCFDPGNIPERVPRAGMEYRYVEERAWVFVCTPGAHLPKFDPLPESERPRSTLSTEILPLLGRRKDLAAAD